MDPKDMQISELTKRVFDLTGVLENIKDSAKIGLDAELGSESEQIMRMSLRTIRTLAHMAIALRGI